MIIDFFFVLRLQFQKTWDMYYTIAKVFSRPFQLYITSPKFQKFQLVKPKKTCSRLATAEQAGQKNCNGKTTIFSTSALKESWASTYYWQCFLGEDWMVNMMIIYVKKIIAKALEFNDIIKFSMGMLA